MQDVGKWFRLRPDWWGLNLKTPADAPAFSERYGYEKPIIRFLGYRLFVLRPIRPWATVDSTSILRKVPNRD